MRHGSNARVTHLVAAAMLRLAVIVSGNTGTQCRAGFMRMCANVAGIRLCLLLCVCQSAEM